MTIWNLTTFRPDAGEGSNLKGANEPGRWLPLGGSLAELGRAIEGDGRQTDIVRSTPDPWAQFRAFADALLFRNDALPDVVPHWRGLLALFALRSEYRKVYDLDLEAIDVTPGSSRFLAVLSRLPPRRTLPLGGEAVARWERPVIVRLRLDPDGAGRADRGTPIAALNPACLIAPGRDVATTLHVASIPWLRKGLEDPTALPLEQGLPDHELWLLHGWLEALRKDIEAQCTDQTDAVFMALRQQLAAYAQDCIDDSRTPRISAHPVSVKQPETWGAPPAEALFALLTRQTPIDEKALAGRSDCIIPLRDDLDFKPFKGLVLLDPGLPATLRKPASRVVLWGKTTLKAAMETTDAGRDQLRKMIAEAGYLLVTPEDFFTPVMAILDDQDFPGVVPAHRDEQGNLSDSLLPLTPLVLLLRQGDRLLECLRRDGTAITLAVDIGRGETLLQHPLRKIFREAALAPEGRLVRKALWDLSEAALWPNFRWTGWHHYYARIKADLNATGRLQGRLMLSGPSLARRLGRKAEGVARADGAADLCSGRPFVPTDDPLLPGHNRLDWAPGQADDGEAILIRSAENGLRNVLQKSDKPFEACCYAIAPKLAMPGLHAGQLVPAGMVLISVGQASPQQPGKVAVDFGTTNTVARFGHPPQGNVVQLARPSRCRFRPRLVDPIHRSNGETSATRPNMDRQYVDFLPPVERLLPTPSVVMSSKLDAAAETAISANGVLRPAELPLFRQLIYFQPDVGTGQEFDLRDWQADLARIMFDLKWGTDQKTKEASVRFLSQMLLMIAAEMVDEGFDPSKSTWVFARPEALPDQNLLLAQIQTALHRLFGVPANEVSNCSEGRAAGAYILSQGAGTGFAQGKATIVLDIGGATTDISIWNDRAPNVMVGHDSLRIAGGDFFTQVMVRNPALLSTLRLQHWSQLLTGEVNRLGGHDPSKVAELLFSGEQLNRMLDQHWPFIQGNPEVVQLIDCALVFLGGVAWHVGHLLTHRFRDAELASDFEKDIAFALCGRGAGLFGRLMQGDEAGLLRRVLGLAAVAALGGTVTGSGVPAVAKLFVTREAKEEVVCGVFTPLMNQLEKLMLPTGGAIPFAMAAESPKGVDPEFRAFLMALQGAGLTVSFKNQQWDQIVQHARNLIIGIGSPEEEAAAAAGLPKFVRHLKGLVASLSLPVGHPDRPKIRKSGAAQ